MSASSPTSQPVSGGFGIRSLLNHSLRLAIMLVIAATGLMLLQTYRAMLHDESVAPLASAQPPQGERRAALAAAANPLGDLGPTNLLQPGAWALGDSAWLVSVGDLAAAGGDARLRSLGVSGEEGQSVSPLEAKILDWLRCSSRPAIVEGRSVYDVRLGQLRVRAVTRHQGQRERLQLVQVVWWPTGAPAQLLEAKLAPPSSRKDDTDGHLLPLPAGVTSLARRWDESGCLACEILGPASPKNCLREWSAAGWTVEKIGEEQGPISLVLLRKDGRVIQLFPVQAGLSGSPAYLLLTAHSAEQ